MSEQYYDRRTFTKKKKKKTEEFNQYKKEAPIKKIKKIQGSNRAKTIKYTSKLYNIASTSQCIYTAGRIAS
jgi:hypothetical protein